MDSPPIVDVRAGVTSIIQNYSEAGELLKKYRKGRTGKKGPGYEECETSLYEGKATVEVKFDRFSVLHGAKFGAGDRKCVDKLLEIRQTFQVTVLDILKACVDAGVSKSDKIDASTLRRGSETTKNDTIMAMDELASRIQDGSVGTYSTIDPGDALPHMPLRPPRPVGPSASSSQTSFASNNPQGSGGVDSVQSYFPDPQASQASFASTSASINSCQNGSSNSLAPNARKNNVYGSSSNWEPPDFSNSQAMVLSKPSSSSSALSWVMDKLPLKPSRAYYDVAPNKPIPAVVPTFVYKHDDDSADIIEEGRRAVQRLRDAASRAENDLSRVQARSAPIPQEPWKKPFGQKEGDVQPRPRTSLTRDREITPPIPDDDGSQIFLAPIRPPLDVRPSSAQGGRRIRSVPKLEFSAATPGTRRHFSESRNAAS